MRDTIFALSSGTLPAGIAVVRVSGPKAGAILVGLCGRLPAERRAEYVTFRVDGKVLDRGLVVWFPGPGSFTGEDVAELHLHGSRAVVASLFGSLSKMATVRSAVQGEFSRRAFDAGKLDLTQVEGLSDLIAADTEVQRRQSLVQASGVLRARCERWRDELIAVRARLEAGLDFSDEPDVHPVPGLEAEIGAIRLEVDAALASTCERLRDGYRVVLAGLPNAGKSTLLNALAGRDAAIVTAEPGTTRDVLEVALDLGGYPVLLYDTAGLRDTASAAEQEGVRRARAAAENADLVLWLTELGDEDASLEMYGKDVVVVLTKCDLNNHYVGGEFRISAKTGEGVGSLLAFLEGQVAASLGAGDGLVTRSRQREWLSLACGNLKAAAATAAPEIQADLLRSATDAIGRVTGRVGVEDVLDALFGEFCIGK